MACHHLKFSLRFDLALYFEHFHLFSSFFGKYIHVSDPVFFSSCLDPLALSVSNEGLLS